MQVLFEGRPDVFQIRGKVRCVQGKAKLDEQPVLEGSNFIDKSGSSIWGTVMHDGGRFRMWYQSWPQDWDGNNGHLVAYAESDNGIDWHKPELNLLEYGEAGKAHNLVDLGFHSPAIFIDPAAPASHRYRATGCAQPQHKGCNPAVEKNGYHTAHSADGLSWTIDSPLPEIEGSDTIKSIYHPGRGKGIITFKRGTHVGKIGRRSVWTADFKDGVVSNEVQAMIPDDFDDVVAHAHACVSTDYYAMGMLPCSGESTIGFVENFRHHLPRTAGSEKGVYGVCDVGLAYQHAEGYRWLHPAGRRNFLTHDEYDWCRGGYYLSSGPITVADEQWMYVTGMRETHAWYVDTSWKRVPELLDSLIERGLMCIGRARWPKWRLFGFESDPYGEVVLNLPSPSSLQSLRLNYETRNGGSVRVEVMNAKGDAIKFSDPIGGSSFDAPVIWGGKASIPQTDEDRLWLRIVLDQATVWAFDLIEEQQGG